MASGSQAENFAQKGAARVAGLSVFQGTPKSSALRLARNLENLGAQVKTYSDREKVVHFTLYSFLHNVCALSLLTCCCRSCLK